jgi:hypothetical protein
LSVLKTSSTYEFAFEVFWDSLRFMAGQVSWAAGFSEVSVLRRGMQRWNEAGLPVAD